MFTLTQEAEEFAEQDKAVKARIDARNQLETYAYNVKTTVEDKAKDKVRNDGHCFGRGEGGDDWPNALSQEACVPSKGARGSMYGSRFVVSLTSRQSSGVVSWLATSWQGLHVEQR